MTYIFLDESGQFTKHDDGEYFIVGSFTIGDQRRTDKAWRSWLKEKFPPKMRTQSEIKWSQRGIPDDLRLKTLKHIARMDVRIRYGFLLRNNIPADYISGGKIQEGVLYTDIIGNILEQYMPPADKEVHIFCDQRHLKGMTKRQFQENIRARLLIKCSSDTLIDVQTINSISSSNIQISDWISGALARYHECGKFGEEFYKILNNNLLSKGQEFFPNN